MKQRICILTVIFLCHTSAYATSLLDAYQDALANDPIYQAAISQRLSTKEGVPISIASLLPNISLNADPSLTRTGNAGVQLSGGVTSLSPRNNTARAYNLNLTLTQTIFDYSKFMQVASEMSISKQADAILNAALQSLMVRTSSAYFAVVRDDNNLRYARQAKRDFSNQVAEVKRQQEMGFKTITDFYTAQASYHSSVSKFIEAKITLANDKQNLRVITGKYYSRLTSLSKKLPLVRPTPANQEQWVKTTQQQNWSIKAAQYNTISARDIIKQRFGGHIPTVSFGGTVNRQYVNNINGYVGTLPRNGTSTTTNRAVQFNVNVPLFSGGGVVAVTNQATYDYEVAQQQLEQVTRFNTNQARQSYLQITEGIGQIKSDQQAISYFIRSLRGMKKSHLMGSATTFDLLIQRQQLLQAQTQYSNDTFTYIINILLLKQAAGTLGFEDLRILNRTWLRA